MKEKKQKVVVITGVSSGLGKGLKELYESAGDIVIGLSRSKCDGLFYECDVTDGERVRSVIDDIGAKYGVIDLLINNAGVGVSGALELTTDEEFHRAMDVNVGGVFNVSRAALKFMKRGGKIVNISSTCAYFAVPFRSLYCAAKAAVNMMSYGMRMELKSSGISVVAVCPGEIKTGFTEHRVKNFATNERYGDRVTLAAKKIDDKEDRRMDCAAACKKIYRIAEKKKGATYIVGGKYRALKFASRFVSENFLLNATGKLLG